MFFWGDYIMPKLPCFVARLVFKKQHLAPLDRLLRMLPLFDFTSCMKNCNHASEFHMQQFTYLSFRIRHSFYVPDIPQSAYLDQFFQS